MRKLIGKPGFTTTLIGASMAALALSGCQFYHYSEHTLNAPGEQASEADAPRVTVEMANSAQFRAVPLQVQHAFALDYGGASVTRVQLVPTGTGGTFYQVDYIESGTPGQAVYHADGTTAAPSQGVVILPEPGEVPIAPIPAELPAPSTEPTTQPAAAAAKDFQ